MDYLQILAQLIKATSNNVHYAHFVVRGKAFALLHKLLEDLYRELDEDWDLVTEKLIEFEIAPVNQNDVDWSNSIIEPFKTLNPLQKDDFDGIVNYIFISLNFMLNTARKANKEAEQYANAGLLNLLGDFIQKYEHWQMFTIKRMMATGQ